MIIADVFSSFGMNALDQQTAKTSSFIEVITHADNQLIKDI